MDWISHCLILSDIKGIIEHGGWRWLTKRSRSMFCRNCSSSCLVVRCIGAIKGGERVLNDVIPNRISLMKKAEMQGTRSNYNFLFTVANVNIAWIEPKCGCSIRRARLWSAAPIHTGTTAWEKTMPKGSESFAFPTGDWFRVACGVFECGLAGGRICRRLWYKGEDKYHYPSSSCTR